MKKYFTIFLLTLLLTSCNKTENTEVFVNSREIQKQETIKPEVSQMPKTNTGENIESGTGNIEESGGGEKVVFSSQEDVLSFLKSIENNNSIFVDDTLLNKFGPKANNSKLDEKFYNEAKIFLKKINLENLYDLKDVVGDRELTKNDYRIILNEAKKSKDTKNIQEHIIGLEKETTEHGGFPISVSLFQLEEKYLYLWIYTDSIDIDNYLTLLYDLKTQEIIDVSKNINNENFIHYSENRLWYREFSKLNFSYDLNTRKFTDYSEKSHNKSYKWWIDQSEPDFIVKSFDDAKIINLGKLTRDLSSTDIAYSDFVTYFETNETNSYFASLDNMSCKEYNNCVATIRYGKLKENGLENSKTYEVKGESFETMCWAGGDSTLLLKDNLIITRSGCPVILELTVFDIEQEKFIYRNNTVTGGY